MSGKVIMDLRSRIGADGVLPPVLLRMVLEFAGSLLNKRHRKHRFLQLELKLLAIMHNHRTVSPSELMGFYRHHGLQILADLIRRAIERFSERNAELNQLVITENMLKIC